MTPDTLDFCGEPFVPLAEHALWWPRRRALLVADLHLEKGTAYARRGQFLPPYDSRACIAALARLVEQHGAAEVWCLGDSFHDAHAADRLDGETRAQLLQLTKSLRWTWITGNHDPAVDAAVGGTSQLEAVVDGFVLRHQAEPGEARPELSGHFHPKLRLVVRGRLISRRCFAVGRSRMILPSFGPYTGGLDVTDPAIASVVGSEGLAVLPTPGALRRYPIGALSARVAAVE